MSRITNGETSIGVCDDLSDATLFMVEIAPQWSKSILGVLSITTFWQKDGMSMTIAQLEESEKFVLVSRSLYRYGMDKVL